jgi:MFS family permease
MGDDATGPATSGAISHSKEVIMSAHSISGQTAEPQQRTGLIIGAVAVTLLLASLGQTIVSTALPTIVSDLGGLDHLSWVVIAYLLSSTVVAPIYGKLGDLYGRKGVLQTAIVIFLIGTALSAFSTSMTFLIVARAIQGLGGGGLMVIAMTVVADVIPPRQRGKVQGVFGGVFGVSTVIGPLLGGFIVEHFGWHWIFLVNLPVGLAAMAVIAAAPVLLALFIWVEARAKEPVLPRSSPRHFPRAPSASSVPSTTRASRCSPARSRPSSSTPALAATRLRGPIR